MEEKDNEIKALLEQLRSKVVINTDKIDMVLGDEETVGSIANAIKRLKGDVGDDVDSLEKILNHINTVEGIIMDVIKEDRNNAKIYYMPKSGEITDMEIGTFIHNIGVASKASINEALMKLRDSVASLEITFNENSIFNLPFSLKISNIVDLELPLPDGRTVPIIHYDLLDEYTLTAYNAFDNDLAGKTVHLHYIDFNNVSVN